MLSILIPSYHEPFLGKTIESVLENAENQIEVIPILDGWIPDYKLPNDRRIKPLLIKKNKGKRNALNAGLINCSGNLVMELDAHCIVGPSFDKILTQNIEPNWLIVPRRYSLDPQKWIRDDARGIVDYHYLSYPIENEWGFGFYARQWDSLTRDKIDPKFDIDDTMTIQASSWVADRKYFLENIYPLDNDNYGPLAQDQQELSLKYWLKGGSVKVNKKTWYAHVAKRWYHYSQKLFSRLHKKDDVYINGNTWGTLHWLKNEEPNLTHKFDWLIEKFSPVPHWPDDWQKNLETIYETD